MKNLKTWQNLVICFIAEVIVFILSAVFLHTFPIRDSSDMLMCFALYEFSCVMGIVAASTYGLLEPKNNPNTDVFEIIVASLLLGIVMPVWHVVLLLVMVFTLILIILAKRKSSVS